MSFIRHVGKVGDRKVAIVFREVPNEPHMCLVTYTETLNMHVHDPLIRCIESDIGQHSETLADALSRSYTQDGKIILNVLHSEGLLKKVQTSQVIVTPKPNTRIKLDELNKILDEMALGEAAVKRLAEIDSSRGIQDPESVARKMRNTPSITNTPDGVLGDNALAKQRVEQAIRMEQEAQGLLVESKRLRDEAQRMDPSLLVAPVEQVAKKRGRPAKVKVSV